MKTIKFIFYSIISSLLFLGCSNDDDSPEVVNEEEVITTVNITLVPQGSGDTVTLSSRDLDGDGPNPPIVTVSGPIVNNRVYDGTIEFLNELESPAEDITEEIEAEAEEHQIFYNITGGVGTVTYNDSDSDGNPIGLSFTLTANQTQAILNGTMTVTLRHEPDKFAAGVSDGDITNAGGETDVQVFFDVSNN